MKSSKKSRKTSDKLQGDSGLKEDDTGVDSAASGKEQVKEKNNQTPKNYFIPVAGCHSLKLGAIIEKLEQDFEDE